MSAQIVVASNLFPGIAGRFDANLRRAFDVAVATCIATADPLTPVDTGALRGNKTIERGSDYAEVHWNQGYAAYVDMGTYKMAARPFAEPGVEAARGPFLAALADLGLG